MVEWGVKDVTVSLLDMDLVQAEREGRIIMLYHTIAMTIVAIEVYFITEITADEAPRADHHQRHHHGRLPDGRHLWPALRLLGA